MNDKQIKPDASHYKKDSFLIVLDSRNASQYENGTYNSKLSFNIKYPIQVPIDCVYSTCVVNSFTCPVSFYQINDLNNTLNYYANGLVQEIQFPHGNYNASTFMTMFKSLMTDFTITYSSTTNKFTIGYTSAFSIYGFSSILSVLGGKVDSTITLLSDGSNNITMPYPCNFAGLNSFNIRCESIRTNNLDSFDACSTSDIIASVPVNAMPNGVIFYEKRNDFEFEFKESVIDRLTIEIMDDQENYLNFNNQHWNLVLQINYIRKVTKDLNTTFHDIINNYSYSNFNNDLE